jgi:hypothetical protein
VLRKNYTPLNCFSHTATRMEGQVNILSVASRRLFYFQCRVSAILGVFLFTSLTSGIADELYGAAPRNISTYLDKLVNAYPVWIASRTNEQLIMKNGTKFSISDHRTDKSFNELLEHPDIDDMFYVPYSAGALPKPPPKNFDPGRVRFEPLFTAMYGDCRHNEVTTKLRTIEWLPAHNGGRLAVTTVNGVDNALMAVSRELDRLPTDFFNFLIPIGGTYNCRAIAGSNTRSMHGYGAAIDLNVKQSSYWRWSNDPTNPIWKNRIPIEIVRVFEKHGFIWGGYWYHFDTMHFEYRPELLSGEAVLE